MGPILETNVKKPENSKNHANRHIGNKYHETRIVHKFLARSKTSSRCSKQSPDTLKLAPLSYRNKDHFSSGLICLVTRRCFLHHDKSLGDSQRYLLNMGIV